MKGFMKGCVITALVCILIGVIVLTASFSIWGWRGIGNMARQGAFTINAWNDFDWYYWNHFSTRRSLEEARREVKDSVLEIKEEISNEIYDINQDIQEELEEAMRDMDDALYGTMMGGLETLRDAASSYERAGGDDIGNVIAKKSQIKNLSINFGGGALHLLRSSDNQARVARTDGKAEFSCYMDDDTLVLVDKGSSRISDYNNRRVYLCIPDGVQFDKVEITVGGGILTLEEVKAEELYITVGAGQAVLERMNAVEAQLDIGAGEILVNKGTAHELSLAVGAGHSAFMGTVRGDLNVDCSMGETELVLAGSSYAHNYYLSSSMGGVKIDGTSYSGLGYNQTVDNGADSDFYLNSSMGMITIEFTE